DRSPALLIEVAARTIPPIVEYPSGRGFRLYPETVTPGPRGQVRLCLVLTDSAFADVFSILAHDVAETVARTSSEQDAVRSFIARVRVWQGFMNRHGPDGLSSEAQTGLFAELSFLESIVLARLLPADAIQAWTGPSGGAQDFVMGRTAIEIKATTAS